MTDALPADTPELERAHGFDSARLIARVRAGDEAGVREAYRRTFGHEPVSYTHLRAHET